MRLPIHTTATPFDLALGRVLCVVHGITVICGLILGGWFLILAAFGTVMAVLIGYCTFARPPAAPEAPGLHSPRDLSVGSGARGAPG